MAGIGEPLDDRAQALRDAGDRIADAVIVHQQEAHDRAYRPSSIVRQPQAVIAHSRRAHVPGKSEERAGEKSQQLLQGPLKHMRAAALALALVPLAAVAAVAGGRAAVPVRRHLCGTVFYDANNNGVQDGGSRGIERRHRHVVSDRRRRRATRSRPTAPGTTSFRRPARSIHDSVQIPPGTQPRRRTSARRLARQRRRVGRPRQQRRRP